MLREPDARTGFRRPTDTTAPWGWLASKKATVLLVAEPW